MSMSQRSPRSRTCRTSQTGRSTGADLDAQAGADGVVDVLEEVSPTDTSVPVDGDGEGDAVAANDASGGDSASDVALADDTGGDGRAGRETGTCAFSPAPPAAALPPDTAASEQAQAEARELVALDALVGRFLRGDVLLYRGTLAAETTATPAMVTNPPRPTGHTEVAEGPALAMLERRLPYVGDWYPAQPSVDLTTEIAYLLVHHLTAHRYVVFAQSGTPATTTWAGGLGFDDDVQVVVTNDFLDSSCMDCAPSFAAQPTTLSLSALQTTGTVSAFDSGVYYDVRVETKTTANLELASPCTLTWDDLAVLATATGPNEFASDIGLRSFAPEGDEMVAHHQSSYGTPTQRGQCATVTSYAIDVWVKRANLAIAGTRNYHVTGSSNICKP